MILFLQYLCCRIETICLRVTNFPTPVKYFTYFGADGSLICVTTYFSFYLNNENTEVLVLSKLKSAEQTLANSGVDEMLSKFL